ncbi:hypothetical protein G3I24_18525 [Micromonospora aurantiaca]|nr:hypothetical protein [Micromonospora aurantiaca]
MSLVIRGERVLVDGAVPDREAEEIGEGGGDVGVAQPLGAGDDVLGVVGRRVGEGTYRHLGDVGRVHEPHPRVAGGADDLATFPGARGVRVRADEVLHEPGRPQHRPLTDHLAELGLHLPESGRAGVDRRRAEQDGPSHPGAPGQVQERQHGRRRVGVAEGRDQVEPCRTVQRRVVRAAVVPVEADALGGRPAAGDAGLAAGGGEFRGDEPAGRSRASNDEDHARTPSPNSSCTASGFQ